MFNVQTAVISNLLRCDKVTSEPTGDCRRWEILT
jgi:hypothetical protein